MCDGIGHEPVVGEQTGTGDVVPPELPPRPRPHWRANWGMAAGEAGRLTGYIIVVGMVAIFPVSIAGWLLESHGSKRAGEVLAVIAMLVFGLGLTAALSAAAFRMGRRAAPGWLWGSITPGLVGVYGCLLTLLLYVSMLGMKALDRTGQLPAGMHDPGHPPTVDYSALLPLMVWGALWGHFGELRARGWNPRHPLTDAHPLLPREPVGRPSVSGAVLLLACAMLWSWVATAAAWLLAALLYPAIAPLIRSRNIDILPAVPVVVAAAMIGVWIGARARPSWLWGAAGAALGRASIVGFWYLVYLNIGDVGNWVGRARYYGVPVLAALAAGAVGGILGQIWSDRLRARADAVAPAVDEPQAT